MKRLAVGILAFLVVSATSALANDGDYTTAEGVAITQPIAGGPAGGREGFWLISLGGGDMADGYRIEPPPQAGDRIYIVGSTEDSRPIPIALELVRRFGGAVAARASLKEGDPHADWSVDAPVFLRVSMEADSAPVELLVGVRIISGTQEAVQKPSTGKRDSSAAPLPRLVVPLD